MNYKEKLNELWQQISLCSPVHLNENFEKITDALTEFLIDKLLDKEKFEIGTFEDGRQKGALLAYTDNEGQKSVEIRLKKKSRYELFLLVQDREGEFITYKHKLTPEEIEIIPKKLRDMLHTVRELDTPVTFYNNLADNLN